MDILTVNASDADTADNGRIRFSLVNPPQGFTISGDGVLRANLSMVQTHSDVELIVEASDSGKPSLQSRASVRLQINSATSFNGQITKRDYRYILSLIIGKNW